MITNFGILLLLRVESGLGHEAARGGIPDGNAIIAGPHDRVNNAGRLVANRHNGARHELQVYSADRSTCG
jgi:hypothetical protein